MTKQEMREAYLAEKRERAKEMYFETTMSRSRIAKAAGVSQSTICVWARKYNWDLKDDMWPADARFDAPGMMVSEFELAKERNDFYASMEKIQQMALAAV